MEQINLINEIDLTGFVEGIVYDSLAPIQDRTRSHKDISRVSNYDDVPLAYDGTGIAIKSEAFNVRNFLNIDALQNDINGAAQFMVRAYIKDGMRTYLNQFRDTEFLTRAEINDNASDYQKEQAAAGVIFYKFSVNRFPEKLKNDLKRLANYMMGHATKYIEHQISNPDNFKFNRRQLAMDFPNFNQTIIKSKWDVKLPEIPKSNNPIFTRNDQHE